MATDYSPLLDEYPETISADQLYKICHISKRKATWLLENGYIPCEDTGKKTRRFKIRTVDVITYLTQLETSLASPLPPPGIFSSVIKDKAKHTVVEQVDPDKFTKMLRKKWSRFPDALTVNDITKLTGYCPTTVSEWIRKGKITGICCYSKYLIPKDNLIEYMSTNAHRDIQQKSKKHKDLIRKYCEEQYDPICK